MRVESKISSRSGKFEFERPFESTMVRSTTSSNDPLDSLLQLLPAEVAHLVASGIKTRAASRMACSRLKAMVDEGTTSLTWRPENGSLVGSSLFSAAFLSRFSNLRRIKVSGSSAAAILPPCEI